MRTLSKIAIIAIMSAFLALSTSYALTRGELAPLVSNGACAVRAFSTATTTYQRCQYQTFDFTPKFLDQGACIKIMDSDGAGYTYLTTLNGVATFSKISCE